MRIGIDLGGTKTEGLALDAAGNVLMRRRLPTPRGDYPATVETVARLVDSFERELGRRGSVGVGIPGAVSPASGLIKNANSTWLLGTRLGEDLSARLRRPVRLANDADCFALSEATDGAGAGAATVFGVIVGTGVGGGIVVGGRLLAGPNAIAGEWGHNPLPGPRLDAEGGAEWPGPLCYCGRTGCIETFLSGPGLTRDFNAAVGRSLTPEEVVREAEQGDHAAEASLRRYEDRMARALASIINVLDPGVIVLGGGLSNMSRLYRNVPEQWGRHVFSDAVATRLVPPLHGDSSGVRGAAWLWGRDAEVPGQVTGHKSED